MYSLLSNDKKITCLILICTNCRVTFIFWAVFALFSVMMPASLLRKRTKTSPKYEQTEATYFFIITKTNVINYI